MIDFGNKDAAAGEKDGERAVSAVRAVEPGSRSLGARSVALSLLLGTHPPRLPASTLVRAGAMFGISSGAMRTALSRMSSKGEVRSTGKGYVLSGRLVDRQRRQDAGRQPVSDDWDRRWRSVTPLRPSRSLGDRREFRRTMTSHRFGELRPDYWLRPANLAETDLGPELLVITGTLDVVDERELVASLWALDEIRSDAERFLADMERMRATSVGQSLAGWLVPAFELSADIVRFLMTEPALPPQLTPSPWPPALLRTTYNGFEKLFQERMGEFLRSAD